jgi:hypothetical protein
MATTSALLIRTLGVYDAPGQNDLASLIALEVIFRREAV